LKKNIIKIATHNFKSLPLIVEMNYANVKLYEYKL